MPLVGPQLPPHLQKRKRSIDEVETPNNPPHKVQVAIAPRTLGPSLPPSQNPDALDLEDTSDDDCGPSLPPSMLAIGPSTPISKSSPSRVLGPTAPPTQNPDEAVIGDDGSDDGYRPSILQQRALSPPPKRRILGPALPPAALSERPAAPANADDISDSEDDYGPSLPPAAGSAAESALFAQQAAERERNTAKDNEPAKPQRAEWMLVPPSDSSFTQDPTKMKNRKFASGKGAKAPAEKGGISAIWTETPEQRRQRLEDEVLGRKDAATSSRSNNASTESRAPDAEEIATARRIKEYNDQNRGKSLQEIKENASAEMEGKRGKKEEDDDPSKRAFDREKDMALGGRMGHGQKREMMAKAADFGSRFQRGRYL